MILFEKIEKVKFNKKCNKCGKITSEIKCEYCKGYLQPILPYQGD